MFRSSINPSWTIGLSGDSTRNRTTRSPRSSLRQPLSPQARPGRRGGHAPRCAGDGRSRTLEEFAQNLSGRIRPYWGCVMRNVHAVEQIWARDESGMRHAVTAARSPIPDAPHLLGLPRFTWGAGRSLTLVDANHGVLECAQTKQRLTVEDWGGAS